MYLNNRTRKKELENEVKRIHLNLNDSIINYWDTRDFIINARKVELEKEEELNDDSLKDVPKNRNEFK